MTKGLPVTAHVQTGTMPRANIWGAAPPKRQDGKQQESCDEGMNKAKVHGQKNEEQQGSHCPSSTCQAGMKAKTNIELTLHRPKVEHRPPAERQTSAFKVTHLLRVIFQFQTISSFFAFSLKRIVKKQMRYTGQRTPEWA